MNFFDNENYLSKALLFIYFENKMGHTHESGHTLFAGTFLLFI